MVEPEEAPCEERCQFVEVGLTDTCEFGCKVVACIQCKLRQVSHRAVYGCPIGRAEMLVATC